MRWRHSTLCARPRLSQGRRAVRAVFILAAVLFCVVAVDGVLEAVPGSVARESAVALAQGPSESSNGEDTRELFDAFGSSVPDAASAETVERELFSLADKKDVRMTDEGDVVGFVVDDDADVAFERLSRELEEKGWSRIEGGHAGAAGFAKDGGECVLCTVSCLNVAGSTSVVVQCVRSNTE